MAKKLPASEGASASKSLLFMTMAMITGFCVLLGAGLVTASRLIRSLQLRQGSDKSTVRTPIGEFRMEKASQVGPGLPVYPQASLVLPGGAASLPPAGDSHPQVVSSTYHANTPREFVVNWYLEHLSAEFVRQEPGHRSLPTVFSDSQIADDDVVFIGERGDQVRLVALSSDGPGTKITLLRSATATTR
jgi:hypothetical protein